MMHTPTKEEAVKVFDMGIQMIEWGDDLRTEIVPRLMGVICMWDTQVFNFTALNHANEIEDRAAYKRELDTMIRVARAQLIDDDTEAQR